MSAKKGKIKCPECGKKLDAGEAACPHCGFAGLSPEENTEQVEVRKRNVPLMLLKGFFSVIFSALFIAFSSLFTLLLFLKLNIGKLPFPVPSMGIIKGDGLKELVSSWLPAAFVGVFICIFLLLIMVTNAKRLRNVFIYVGVSLIIVSLVCIAVGIAQQYTAKFFIAELRDILSYYSAGLLTFETVCAVAALVTGLLFIIISVIVWAAKKGSAHKEQAHDVTCPLCGAAVRAGLSYCESCGNPLSETDAG